MRRSCFALIGILALVLGAMFMTAACKGKDKTAPPAAEKPSAPQWSLDTLVPVFGKAEAEKPGLFEVSTSGPEIQMTYHFYTAETKDIDDDIGRELGPKVREFYIKFKEADRVLFMIQVMRSGVDPGWASYCSFVMTRQIFSETDWTTILDNEFFKAVLELKYSQRI